MPRDRAGATVQALSQDALARVEDLRDVCLPLLVAAEPAGFYTPESLADLHLSALSGLSSLLTVLAGLPDPDDVALEQARQIGRRQVQQNLPLEGVLRGYRIVGQCVWEQLVATARASGTPVGDALLDGATELWRVVDLLSGTASHAYREEEQRLRTREDRVQAALLASLLDGQGSDPRFARDAAAALGLTPGSDLVCVVGLAEVPGSLAFDNVQERLHAADVPSVWVTQAGVEVGLVMAGKLGPRRLGDLLEPAVRTRAGMSPVFHALSELPTSRRLAELAARCSTSAGSLRSVDDDLVAGLVIDAPLVAGRLYDRTIGRLLAADPEEGPALLATVRAFLEAGCSMTDASRATFVHRNTMLQRLNRIDKLTGTALRTFPDQVMWLLALKELDGRS